MNLNNININHQIENYYIKRISNLPINNMIHFLIILKKSTYAYL